MRIKYIFFIFIICVFYHCSTTGMAQEENNPNLLFVNLADSAALKNKTSGLKEVYVLTANKKPVQDWYNNEFLTSTKVQYERLVLASMLLISLNYAAYQPFKDAWWEEERANFHFYRGWRRNRGYWDFGWHDTLYGHLDKLGHYYSARLLSEQIYYISRWIGFNKNSSSFIGPILSSLLMLEIEIYDGFFKDWGFSLADFTANELGAFSPLLGEKIPLLSNFQLKLSYHPSNLHQQESTFIKDYAGMTYWLCFNIHSVLPIDYKKYYPTWLNLALGYSVSKPTRGKIELYLAPDINWMKVPLGRSQTMHFIKKTLNYFHFPCFALKLMPNKKFYTIYF